VVFVRGEGAYLFDSEGRRYLDFMAGIAVNALGHADAEWAAVVAEQAGRLTHVSNLYHNQPQIELARLLVENSFADRVFFTNSGSEANETALKVARKYARRQAGANDNDGAFAKTGIIAFSHSFHGRTMGALATTHKAQYRQPFGPLVPGVTFAEYNDIESATVAIGPECCAVIVEPVQGEGGVHPATPEFLAALRHLCDEHGALLIFDEVQCGLGRTGHLWAYQGYNVVPDIMTIAKPLAGGLPLGAALMREEVATVFRPGDHGSTFAAGPLVCSAALVTLRRIAAPSFLAGVEERAAYLQHRLRTLESERIVAVRGAGLLVGVECRGPVAPTVSAARERGLLVINAGENVLRLCPPLIIERHHIDEAMNILADCLA
jgi:predicted acetylornithine/succinylornithine family transaminase